MTRATTTPRPAHQMAVLETAKATYWITVAPFPGSDTMWTLEVRTRWAGRSVSFIGRDQVFDTEWEARAEANATWLRLREDSGVMA